MLDVQNDPDRVIHPLKTHADGEFERVCWDEALADIGDAAAARSSTTTGRSRRLVHGQPGRVLATRTRSGCKGFLDGLGSPHYYTAGSQDVNNRFAASALLYGTPLVVPIPDLERTGSCSWSARTRWSRTARC